jgi:hypothetical protein
VIVVALLELAGGLEAVGGALWKVTVGGPMPDHLALVVLSAFGCLSLAAGGMLFIGSRASRVLSVLVQGLQVVRLYSPWFAFSLFMGPQVAFLWTTNRHDLILGQGASVTFNGYGTQFATRGIEVNLLALALLCVLVLPAFRERHRAAVPSPV